MSFVVPGAGWKVELLRFSWRTLHGAGGCKAVSYDKLCRCGPYDNGDLMPECEGPLLGTVVRR